ncbi:hypothetical protein [Rossellomorea aquimaris]|uniref:hypothetical protein n=1 Tax=Rossellomorea aquimaris TaxID=189382 RepID=UPI0007D09C5A|nr:hypothetical protein [Rossellomorea aquimaris]
MGLFLYQGQEEDHYTHLLMCILDFDHNSLIQFLQLLIPQSKDFKFEDLSIHTRRKKCPHLPKAHEYIIGIAPYQSGLPNNILEDNSGSIPDAWICGENFNLLFEFKIRGTLDEGQIAAHKKLLSKDEVEVLKLTWDDVMNCLNAVDAKDPIQKYLIDNFLILESNFKSKRRSSGMPREIISNKKRENELFFTITGSKNHKPYIIEQHYKGQKVKINDQCLGIQEARRFIAEYVIKNFEALPLRKIDAFTEISDFCIAPGRTENKNQWNQWRLGAFAQLP